MGNLFTKSLPSPTPEGVKQILNTILQELFKRADFIDLYSLADPERCKRYIVVAESALKKLFVKVQLQPKLGADGTFMVQKLEGLQKKNPLGPDQPKYCLELAFYFIRIFQIYAALVLSVLDGDLPVEEIQAIRKSEESIRENALLLRPDALRGFPQGRQPSRGFFSFFGRGGALTGAPEYRSFYLTADAGAGLYTVLNRFLVRPPTGSVSKDDMRFERYSDMLIPQEELYEFPEGDPQRRRTKPTLAQTPPTIRYTLPRGNFNDQAETITAKLQLQRDASKMLVTLLEARRQSNPGKVESPVSGELYYTSSTDENPKSKKGQDLPDMIAALFQEIVMRDKKDAVSAIPFLHQFGYLRRLEGDVPIEGTNIFIHDPKRAFIDDAKKVKLFYKDRVKFEESTTERSVTIMIPLSVTKEPKLVGKPHTYTVTLLLNDIDVEPSELESRFRQENQTASSTFTTDVLEKSHPPRNARSQTVPDFLQKFFKRIVSGQGLDPYEGGLEFKKGIPQPYNSPAIPPPLKIKDLWQALAKDPPVKSYCVARAVQLLNVAAIRGNFSTESFTNACRMKFPYVKEGYVPAAGAPVHKVPAIGALGMLFFDTIEKGMPKIAATDKYATFVKTMKGVFEGSDAAAAVTDTTAFDSVEDTISAAACSGRNGDSRLPISKDVAEQLQTYAQKLLDRQVAHITKVMPLLFKMFDQETIMKKQGLMFNPKFAAGGMAAANQLAEEARNLLVEYYSECEQTYKAGLAIFAATPRPTTTGPKV